MPRACTAARCLNVESRWDRERVEAATDLSRGGAPRAHCVPPPRAEPRLAAAGIDTHAAGAARVPGAVGRARHKAPFAHASQAFLAHHSPYALGVDAPALGMQRVGDTPAAVAPPDLRFLMLGREFKSRDITPMARTC